MSNPVFTRNRVFTDRTPAGYPAMPGYQVGNNSENTASPQYGATSSNTGFTQRYPESNYPQQSQQPQPARTSYGTNESYASGAPRPVTMDDMLIKTLITFGALLVAGGFAWFTTAANPTLGMPFMIGGSLAAFVLAMVNSFRRKVSPFLILAYAAAEGLALGAISFVFSNIADGVVGKAILATLVTTVVMLVLFKTKVIRNSPTLMRVTTIGLVSIAAVYLLNFIIGIFAPSWTITSITIGGFPLWVVISLVAVVLAAVSLVSDFDFINQAVENRAPVETSWLAAFGLMVTLVWLYLEFLRLFAYFANNE